MIERVSRVWREEGLRGVWFGFLAKTCYRRLELVELDLTVLPSPAELRFPLEFGFLREEDLPAYAKLGAPTDAGEARGRLERGDRCFVAWLGGDVVSARWIVEGRGFIAYLDRWLELASDEVYLHETYTQPPRRGSGVSAAAGTRLAHALVGEGRQRILAAVLAENRAGRRAYEKAGYRRTGRIGFVKLGPWRRDFLHSEQRREEP